MMNLFKMITEKEQSGQYRKELTEHRFLDLLNSQSRNSHAVAKKVPIFTHLEGAGDFLLVTPDMKEHRSPFWIDKLIRKIPGWNRYPSRARCLKGYTDRSRSSDGKLYVVFPHDRARVGICSEKSFYRSFKLVNKDLDITRMDNPSLVKWLKTIASALTKLDSKVKIEIDDDVETLSAFEKSLSMIDKAVNGNYMTLLRDLKKSDDHTKEEAKALKDFLDKHTPAHRYLEAKLDPDSNGFSTVRIESFHKPTGDREVWISEPCLLVTLEKYKEMHKRGDIK